ncbi:MAG: YkgJ family cysteine cluster protein [Phycisphaerae bacterium]
MHYPYLMPDNGDDPLPAGWEVQEFSFGLPDHPSTIRIAVPPGPTALSRLVPLARALSDRVSQIALNQLHVEGHRLLCRRGCDACCHYLLPVSLPELFQFRREFAELGSSTKYDRLRRFQSVAEAMVANPPEDDSAESLSCWHVGLGLACPMLQQKGCGAYRNRPLACREYAYIIADGPTPTAARLRLSVSYAEMMGTLHATLTGQNDPEYVLFPLSFAWLDANPRRLDPVLPGGQLVRLFVEHVRAAALGHRPGEGTSRAG